MAQRIVDNRSQLVKAPNEQSRRLLLDILIETIERIHPHHLLGSSVTRAGNVLRVEGAEYDMSDYDNVYVLGAGKGATTFVEALLEVLNGKVNAPLIVDKHSVSRQYEDGCVIEAGHPLPTEESIRAGRAMLDIADSVDQDDLVIVCISGGASSLVCAPIDGIELEDVRQVTDLLLRSGATIDEINAVRKHISKLKGGQFVDRIYPGDTLGLIIVDEVAGSAWGPTSPDSTTYQTAVDVIRHYDLWEDVPMSVQNHLESGCNNTVSETLDTEAIADYPVHNVVLATAHTLCDAAAEVATNHGVNPHVLSSTIEGESRDVGSVLGSIAREVRVKNRPFNPPCILISGGETTVTLPTNHGVGGPNQELALSVAMNIDGYSNIIALAIGTDGTDGPTDVAGGIVDGYTIERANERGIDVVEELKMHNSSNVLNHLGDAIITGTTPTNLMDLRMIHIGD